MSDETKPPCPFCGCRRIIMTGRDDAQAQTHQLACDLCGASSGHCRTPEGALAAWARRAPPESDSSTKNRNE